MVKPSFFQFQLESLNSDNIFSLVPKFSKGSIYFFTSLLLNNCDMTVTKSGVSYGPEYGYFHAYPSCNYVLTEKGFGIDKPIAVFQTQMYSNTYGLVRLGASSHAYIFRIVDGNCFEVLIFKHMKDQSLLLLQMLKDGSFDAVIEELKTNN
jgi:hypothetical protein